MRESRDLNNEGNPPAEVTLTDPEIRELVGGKKRNPFVAFPEEY